MLAISRFSVLPATATTFLAQARRAHEVLAQCAGYEGGEVGQNVDDPNLWVLMTRWKNIGSYRRALSAMNVKMEVVPLLAQAIDEPGAYDLDFNK
jgi:quinol monooxygenase YgiN